MYVRKINENIINLKERMKGYTGGFGGWKGEMMRLYYGFKKQNK